MADPIKVLVVADNKNGVSRYRLIEPTRAVKSVYPEVEIYLEPYASEPVIQDYNRFGSWGLPDLVLLHGFNFDGVSDINMNLALMAREFDIPVIYDIDDNAFSIPPLHPFKGKPIEGFIAESMQKMIEIADALTVSTDYLKRVVEERGGYGKTITFPNSINAFDPIWSKSRRDDPDKVRIGWFAAPGHGEDNLLFSEIMDKASAILDREIEVVTFSDLGKSYIHTTTESNGQETFNLRFRWGNIQKQYPLVPPDVFPYLYSSIDLAVAPLVDNEFNRSRSWLKVLEAGAAGIPIIASNIQPYNEAVFFFGKDVFISDDLGSWVDYIVNLVRDNELRKTSGENLRRSVRKASGSLFKASARYALWNQVISERRKATNKIIRESQFIPPPIWNLGVDPSEFMPSLSAATWFAPVLSGAVTPERDMANVEVRRSGLSRMRLIEAARTKARGIIDSIDEFGTENLLEHLGAAEVQRDEYGVLYRAKLPEGSLQFIKVQNSTPEEDGTYKDYILRVPPDISRAREGVAWTFNIPEEKYQLIEES